MALTSSPFDPGTKPPVRRTARSYNTGQASAPSASPPLLRPRAIAVEDYSPGGLTTQYRRLAPAVEID